MNLHDILCAVFARARRIGQKLLRCVQVHSLANIFLEKDCVIYLNLPVLVHVAEQAGLLRIIERTPSCFPVIGGFAPRIAFRILFSVILTAALLGIVASLVLLVPAAERRFRPSLEATFQTSVLIFERVPVQVCFDYWRNH